MSIVSTGKEIHDRRNLLFLRRQHGGAVDFELGTVACAFGIAVDSSGEDRPCAVEELMDDYGKRERMPGYLSGWRLHVTVPGSVR